MLSVSGPRQKNAGLYIRRKRAGCISQKAFPIRHRRTRTPSHCCCCRDTPPWTRVWTKTKTPTRAKQERGGGPSQNIFTQKNVVGVFFFLGNVTSFVCCIWFVGLQCHIFLPAAGCLWRGRLADPSIVGLSLLRLLPSVRTGNRPPVTSTSVAVCPSRERNEQINFGDATETFIVPAERRRGGRGTRRSSLCKTDRAATPHQRRRGLNGVRLHAFTQQLQGSPGALPLVANPGGRRTGQLCTPSSVHSSSFLAALKESYTPSDFFFIVASIIALASRTSGRNGGR